MDDPAERAAMGVLPPPPPTPAERVGSTDMGLETIRLQADEHPLIDDAPATSAAEHCLRLMHLKAYEEAAAISNDRDVLDVGCNTGYGTLRFRDVARRVVGVDVSEKAIEAARATAVDGRPEFRVIDGVRLPFGDASFDVVVSFQVLEHIADPLPYLREISRVTRPGGTVVFTTPNAATRLDPGMTPWNRFHVREYRAPELAALLGQVFPQVRVRGMFGTPTLYETEIARVDGARRRVRTAEATRRAALEAAGRTQGRRRRPLPVRVARAMIPAGARSWLRRTAIGRSPAGAGDGPRESVATPTATEAMPLETFLRFSLADLFYADTDLERAMDFMAICGLDGSTALSEADGAGGNAS